MFGKKKNKEQPKPVVNYTDWEKDLGFLNLILARKKNITKEFVINVFSGQMQDKDYLKDEDIEPIINNIVTEVYTQIGEHYKQFLIEKYFGSKENLISFITEDVYVELVSDTIKRNNSKIRVNTQREYMKRISSLNIQPAVETKTSKKGSKKK